MSDQDKQRMPRGCPCGKCHCLVCGNPMDSARYDALSAELADLKREIALTAPEKEQRWQYWRKRSGEMTDEWRAARDDRDRLDEANARLNEELASANQDKAELRLQLKRAAEEKRVAIEELASAIENALKDIDRLKRREVPR